jgi:uroporphyrinogen-III synthase
MQVAEAMQAGDAVRRALAGVLVASIGPTTSEELRRRGIVPRFEPSHPKMGYLVRETAELLAAGADDRA